MSSHIFSSNHLPRHVFSFGDFFSRNVVLKKCSHKKQSLCLYQLYTSLNLKLFKLNEQVGQQREFRRGKPEKEMSELNDGMCTW